MGSMSANSVIRLALTQDAANIAAMSRAYIEQGLGWSWTEARVLRAIRDAATNVATAQVEGIVLGFGIMQYGDDAAHLSLLAVDPAWRQRGLGAQLVAWLEQPARVAGIERVRVEARADNPRAIDFYRRHGFREFETIAGYYRGEIDAVRLEKKLAPGSP